MPYLSLLKSHSLTHTHTLLSPVISEPLVPGVLDCSGSKETCRNFHHLSLVFIKSRAIIDKLLEFLQILHVLWHIDRMWDLEEALYIYAHKNSQLTPKVFVRRVCDGHATFARTSCDVRTTFV